MTTPLVDALDRLARDGLLTPRQHGRLVRAAGYLEGPPVPPPGLAGRLLASLRRPSQIDLLGLRFLRGDLSETSFSTRLKIDCIVIAVVWGALMSVWLLFVLLREEKSLAEAIRGQWQAILALLAGSAVIGAGFFVLWSLPLGYWWRRRRRRWEELSAQREGAGDV